MTTIGQLVQALDNQPVDTPIEIRCDLGDGVWLSGDQLDVEIADHVAIIRVTGDPDA